MNAFQKQLILGDKCMAELAGQDRDGVGQAAPPAKVSIEEFESRLTMRAVDVCTCGHPAKSHAYLSGHCYNCGCTGYKRN